LLGLCLGLAAGLVAGHSHESKLESAGGSTLQPFPYATLGNLSSAKLLQMDTKAEPTAFDVMTTKHFVVISQPRSGGDWLSSMLVTRPDVAVAKERILMKKSNSDPVVNFLHGKSSDGKSAIQGNMRKFQGFQWHNGDRYNISLVKDQAAFAAVLKKNGFNVILVQRNNLLAREVALAKLHSTTGTSATCVDIVCAKMERARRIKLNTNGLADRLQLAQADSDSLRKYVEATIPKSKLLRVTLEEMQAKPKHVLTKVLNFLGSPWRNTESLKTDTKLRMSADTVASSLINADSVKLALTGHEWADELDALEGDS